MDPYRSPIRAGTVMFRTQFYHKIWERKFKMEIVKVRQAKQGKTCSQARRVRLKIPLPWRDCQRVNLSGRKVGDVYGVYNQEKIS